MHFPLSKLQNHICISVHWLSFHRFGKTREWVNKEFSCKAEPCLYWASAVSQQLSMFPSLIVSKLSFLHQSVFSSLRLCQVASQPAWVQWFPQRAHSHRVPVLTQRELMDFDDGKRVVRGRLGLRRIHSHAAACHQQVLTTHSRHFSSHAHPGADPGCPRRWRPGRGLPFPAVPGGRAAGQSDGGGRAQAGWVVAARQAQDLRLTVPGTVALVERVGRCGSLAEAAGAQHAQEGFLKLLTGAGVDDGVDAAVEVAQPKRDLEDGVRGSVCREDGTERKNQEKWKPTKNEASNHDAQGLSGLLLSGELEQTQCEVCPVAQGLVFGQRCVPTVYPQSYGLGGMIRLFRFLSANQSSCLPPRNHVHAAIHRQNHH